MKALLRLALDAAARAAGMPADASGARLARSAAWSVLGTVGARALSIVTSVVTARVLGKVGLGELAILFSTLASVETFAGLGLGLTATKYVADHAASDPERAARILFLLRGVATATGALSALGLLGFAPWLATHTLAAPGLTGPLRVAALTLLVSNIAAVENSALAGLEAFSTLARIQVVAGLAGVVFTFTGVLLGGVPGAMWGNLAAAVTGLAAARLACTRACAAHGIARRGSGWDRDVVVLWRFSLPAYLSGLLVAPVMWACSALLVNRPGGYAEMGTFNAANAWYSALLFVPSAIAQVFLPALSRELSARRGEAVAGLLAAAIRTNGLAAAVPGLAGALLSPLVMRMYGAEFVTGWPVLVVLLATAVLVAVQIPVGQVIAASGRMWIGFWMNLGWSFAILALTAALVPHGALGLALGRLGAYAIHATWTFLFAWRVLRLRVRPGDAPPRDATREVAL